MLEVRDLRVSYGAAPAVAGASLDVEAGGLVVVVGPNGAGKTTLINAIAGLHRPDAGTLRIDGASLLGMPAHRYCDHGVALVPEGRRLFTGLTVRENLELGGYRAAARARRAESLEEVCTIFPVLKERLAAAAGVLSGGQQQMLAIGRALMARPKLLLLDEPSLGLAPAVINDLFAALDRLRVESATILLVDQMAGLALGLADRAYVIDGGRIVACGPASEIAGTGALEKAYLAIN